VRIRQPQEGTPWPDQAVLTVDGPEQEWLDSMGTTLEELDRTNALIFGAIADRRGLSFRNEREGGTFRMIFSR
jgi:hypothetical protein